MSECGINSETGRCVNKGTITKELCIRDSKTKRCRKNKNSTSRKISNKGGCPEGTLLNKSTNECVFKFDKRNSCKTNGEMCSLSLNTRIKDKRNLLANLSSYYDKTFNIPYTPEDETKKCEIFSIKAEKRVS